MWVRGGAFAFSMFVFAFEDEDEDEGRGRNGKLFANPRQPCAQLGLAGVAPQLEPSWSPPLLRGMLSRAGSFVLVLEPARSDLVKLAGVS